MSAKETHVHVATNWGGVLVFRGDVADAVARATEAALAVVEHEARVGRERLEILSVSPFAYNDYIHVTVVVRQLGEGA